MTSPFFPSSVISSENKNGSTFFLPQDVVESAMGGSSLGGWSGTPDAHWQSVPSPTESITLLPCASGDPTAQPGLLPSFAGGKSMNILCPNPLLIFMLRTAPSGSYLKPTSEPHSSALPSLL